MINIEIAYATPQKQVILTVTVEEGATVELAILSSGILTQFPEIDLTQQKVGIFGKRCALSDTVKNGDRIEIYRPLQIDPKEARRAKGRTFKKS